MSSIVVSDAQGYLIIDNNFLLLELSPNAKKFAESPETLELGQDIRPNFPELIGLEETLIALNHTSEHSFILEGIAREKTSDSNLYFNLTVKKLAHKLILFLDDVTELMLLKQSYNQKVNEAEISLNTLKRFEYCTNKIIASMGDILLISDASGIINRANKAVKNILGYSPSEVLNRKITEIVDDPKFDYPKIFKSLKLEDSYSQKLEFTCTTKKQNQEQVTIEFNCFLAPTEVKEIFNCVCIGRDITVRKKAEAEMRMALEKEKELRELKSSFISMASHEFRNPLSSILVCADVLNTNNKSLDSEETKFYATLIKEAALNMQYILEDVLILSKTEAKQQKLNFSYFDLKEFCQQLIQEVKLSHQDRIINLIVSEDSLEVNADSQILWHIITNLLSNALKYSTADKPVNLQLVQQENIVVLEVQDQGIGIPPEAQKHLFESFYRANNVGDIPGTGLGLAIVKRAIDLHQGNVSIMSESGRGTTIRVELPIKT
ncbi:MAG: PAS domain-containing sensor histidine kinase [Xenococcaceae cyanobacterium MO_167.B27]|nr:PAS domain-containing sensor histidine kinase [Xenococcaceae cyanobacterium MO_167.B27]